MIDALNQLFMPYKHHEYKGTNGRKASERSKETVLNFIRDNKMSAVHCFFTVYCRHSQIEKKITINQIHYLYYKSLSNDS